jgi:hypothetical protein
MPSKGLDWLLQRSSRVTLLLAGYCLLMAWQIDHFMPGGRSDDAEALYVSQSLELGYNLRNPPLFDWLVTMLVRLFGPYPQVVYGLRMACLLAMLIGFQQLARRLQSNRTLAVTAGFSVLLILHLHWYVFFDLTHSLLAAVFYPWVLVALIDLRRDPRGRRFLLFGLLLGAGVLSKYTFALFGLALLLALWLNPDGRSLLGDRRMLWILLLVSLMVSPHGMWMAQQLQELQLQARESIGVGRDIAYLQGLGRGFFNLAKASLELLLVPLGVLLVLFFGRGLAAVRPAPRGDDDRLLRDLLGLMSAALLLYVLAGVVLIRPHHLLFLGLLPVWWLGRLSATPGNVLAARRTLLLVLGVMVTFAAVFGQVSADKAQGCRGRCAPFLPYGNYAEQLRQAGFRSGTLIYPGPHRSFSAPMMLQHFPGLRVVTLDQPHYRPPPGAGAGDCLLLWSEIDHPEFAGALRAGKVLPEVGLPVAGDVLFGRLLGNLSRRQLAAPSWSFVLIRGGLGDCR